MRVVVDVVGVSAAVADYDDDNVLVAVAVVDFEQFVYVLLLNREFYKHYVNNCCIVVAGGVVVAESLYGAVAFDLFDSVVAVVGK